MSTRGSKNVQVHLRLMFTVTLACGVVNCPPEIKILEAFSRIPTAEFPPRVDLHSQTVNNHTFAYQHAMHTASVENGLVAASVFWQDSKSHRAALKCGKTDVSNAGLACYVCHRKLTYLSDNCRNLVRHRRVHKVDGGCERKAQDGSRKGLRL